MKPKKNNSKEAGGREFLKLTLVGLWRLMLFKKLLRVEF
jgi:hypothetical protein